jgi:hypothetical protein
VVDSKAQRVLFAEASKDVVDLFLSLLALPLGAAVKLLREDSSMLGSVGDMYASVETLDAAYLAPGASKDALVAPSPAVSAHARSLLGLPDPTVFFFQCLFECPGNYLTDATGVKCPDCDRKMTTKCRYVEPPAQQRKLFKTKRCAANMVTDVRDMLCPCKDKCGEKLAVPCLASSPI